MFVSADKIKVSLEQEADNSSSSEEAAQHTTQGMCAKVIKL